MNYGALGISLDSSDLPIFGSTLVYALIGDPIDHSFSPAIQNAAFRSADLNAVYVAFTVPAATLRSAVQGVRSLRVKGFNVTAPHKLAMLRCIDKVETEAAEIGSINTVKNDDGTLTGFDTDGVGALNAMDEAGISVDGQRVLLIGAGGAGRAIAYALAGRDCSLKLANRTVSSARRLAKSLRSNFGVSAESVALSRQPLRDSVKEADIILNASSMGMDGSNNPPVDKRWIRGNHWVFDIVYRPVQTKLLRDATASGARTINGLNMLVNQGACSFTLWTGKKAPIREMRRAIGGKLMVENVANR
jgi:shikimate dehydrogenase